MEESTRRMILAGSSKSIPELEVLSSQNRPFTRRMHRKQDQHGLRRENSCIGWFTIQTSLKHQNGIWQNVTTGCLSTSYAAWNTALFPLRAFSSFYLLSIVSHLSEDLEFQCFRWHTSWIGDTSGVTRTGGDVQRKSLSHTRSSSEPGASLQWNEIVGCRLLLSYLNTNLLI